MNGGRFLFFRTSRPHDAALVRLLRRRHSAVTSIDLGKLRISISRTDSAQRARRVSRRADVCRRFFSRGRWVQLKEFVTDARNALGLRLQ